VLRRRWIRVAYDYLQIIIGSIITAAALDIFLIPNKIAAGGVSGLATVIFYLTQAPVGVTMLLINIPLFLASLRTFGAHFGFKTVLGTVTLSLAIDFLAGRVSTISDPFLAVLYGGVLTGIGMGITFRGGGTTGGTDLAARIIHHYIPISLGQSLLGIDFIVIALAGFVFNAQLALYAIVVLFLTGKIIDLIQEGINYSKGVIIISKNPPQIRSIILNEMSRGVTVLNGMGGYTMEDKEILFVVVSRSEILNLKNIVQSVDPSAFVVITDVREVLGEGFKED
jgi:uncharacterized membrane-anchored protein YitT (DUF2179 family)